MKIADEISYRSHMFEIRVTNSYEISYNIFTWTAQEPP